MLTRAAYCINNSRFLNSSSQPTDFAADTSEQTSWTSGSGDAPVAYVAGLSTTVTLSKIFVTFSPSFFYQTAVLQFLGTTGSSLWTDLQYYAMDCLDSFGLEPEGP